MSPPRTPGNHQERPGSGGGGTSLGGGARPERTNQRTAARAAARREIKAPNNSSSLGRETALPPYAPQQPITATIRLPVPPPAGKKPMGDAAAAGAQPISVWAHWKRKSGARYLPPVTCGRAARSGRVGRSSRAPGDAAGGDRSPPPLGPRRAARAMTRPLGEGLPSPGPPFAMSRRHVTPATAGREAAQDCRYGRGAGEKRSRSSPGTDPA